MFQTMTSDRPNKRERGPDCLVLFLIDFLFLDLPQLTPEDFASWMTDVADCLWSLNENDRCHPYRPVKGDWWLDQIIHNILAQFPAYPGGDEAIRLDLVRLMLAGRSGSPEYLQD
jgi:hypothetical protein